MKQLQSILILILFPSGIFSQTLQESDTSDLRKDAINVFMDAPSYIKKEVPFINYVRDKKVADLIIIDTRQRTGSGGREITFFIEGQYDYEGIMDTVKFHTSPVETEETIRAKEVRLLKMSMMKYIIGTPLADYIDINFLKPITEEVSTDRWNNWVFRARLDASLSGRETSNSHSFGAMLDADRITSEWKYNFGLRFDNSYTVYDYGEISATNTRKTSNLWGDVVKSLGEHWSVGLSADAYKSIYSNYDLRLSVDPVIEYDIFPYSESTRRMFSIFYLLRVGYNNYADTTQFFKTEEMLISQRIQSEFTTLQKWGSMSLTARWSNYLHDFSLNNLSLNARVNIQIVKGLTINLRAGYSFIHDQVSLRKGNASIEDVLLNRQELSTTYSFNTDFGITYTFGSIYSNVVNPRINDIF